MVQLRTEMFKGCIMEYLKLIPGIRTALADGVIVPDSPKHMATEQFYKADSGDRIHLREEGFLFAVAIFSLKRNPAYIYSYAYQPEENWSTYTGNLTPQSYGEEDYIFDRECYFRVCLRRKDGEDMQLMDFECAKRALEFYHEEKATSRRWMLAIFARRRSAPIRKNSSSRSMGFTM